MKYITALVLGVSSIASASTLSSLLTVDNGFSLYVSTDDASLGTLVGSGNDWTTNYSFTTGLAGGTNYIHVVANNTGGPGGFIGDFSLDDTNFQFVNGTQHLLTNSVDWNFNTTGFGNAYTTSVNEGANGVGPWGSKPALNASAAWLWDPANCGVCTVYFSTAINAAASPAPEPDSMALIGTGLLFAGLWLRKRARSNA